MASLSLSHEQMAGQRIMAGFDGAEFNDDLKRLIGEIKVGGIILFSRNISTPGKTGKMCRDAQKHAAARGLPPLLIAIDQEGGQVARLKEPFERFPGNPAMKGVKDAVYFAKTTAADLKSLGINMNMAPVLDIAPGDMDSVMAGRSFGPEPEWVSKLGAAVIREFTRNGVISAAKHFPGIGRTTLDSHVDAPVFKGGENELESFDLIPFKTAISKGVPCVMLSHILYRDVDPVWPASLSKIIVRGLLREKMGHDGLVVTDDLDMGAIKKKYGVQSVVSRVMDADIDIALICHKGPDIKAAFDEMRKRPPGAHVKSVERILAVKEKFLKKGGDF
ncbi:Beta-N-acetylhexosaminidase [Candidatus Desulfarcum epimagneticum]|uniref:Beta-N-acetylhexosaminidase n=1 Tax=uncultured Desulfobacteraceae bacterium TaxID=218296 RepID=A0A484HNM2_9BACT|nr:Beta-N-acetylhexosaminidase [uncultured Desulfobacteraceae bacterium]